LVTRLVSNAGDLGQFAVEKKRAGVCSSPAFRLFVTRYFNNHSSASSVLVNTRTFNEEIAFHRVVSNLAREIKRPDYQYYQIILNPALIRSVQVREHFGLGPCPISGRSSRRGFAILFLLLPHLLDTEKPQRYSDNEA